MMCGITFVLLITSLLCRLENYPQFLMLLFLGGLQYPVVTALAGIVWIAGKVSYSLGYYSGGNVCLNTIIRSQLMKSM